MARFYTMHLAPTLFGGWNLVREWGRIGSPGTLRIDPFETLEESERALRRIEKQKRKREYLYWGAAKKLRPLLCFRRDASLFSDIDSLAP